MNIFPGLIALLLVAKLAVEVYLIFLNRRSVLAAAGEVPAPYRAFIDERTYDRTVAYTLAKNRLGLWETAHDAVILVLVLYSGVLPWAWGWLTGLLGTGVWAQALALFAIMALLSLASLPFDWYGQFRLEERFGFNKSTAGLWISDKLKGLAIGAVLGIPLLALIIWLVGASDHWWLWGFGCVAVFQLVMLVLYPMFILPLFNKFTELPAGALRERLMALGDRTGFRARTILVMDGSRRSGHSNAFFTGFGTFRRIVLYDTLIEQMPAEDLEAVLAHEIGHYRLGHIPKLMAISLVSLFVTFFILDWLSRSPWFVEGFGFTADGSFGVVLLLFALLSGLISFWTTPLFNALSRQHEYEADAFARQALGNNPLPLRNALRTLNAKNLSNLTPHPVYSAFYYSHPTLLERERALLAEP